MISELMHIANGVAWARRQDRKLVRHGSKVKEEVPLARYPMADAFAPATKIMQVATASARMRHGSRRDSKRWPDPGKPLGAVLYAVVGGMIVWLFSDVLPHIHVIVTWR